MSNGKLALPEGKKYEDQSDDGQSHVSQDRARFREQIIGLRFAGNDGGECGEKQHSTRIGGSSCKNVIGFTSLQSHRDDRQGFAVYCIASYCVARRIPPAARRRPINNAAQLSADLPQVARLAQISERGTQLRLGRQRTRKGFSSAMSCVRAAASFQSRRKNIVGLAYWGSGSARALLKNYDKLIATAQRLSVSPSSRRT
jgi:hypothetical protein